jgi:aminopeptidase
MPVERPAIGEVIVTDPRVAKLARLLIEHSCALQPGEKVLVEAIGVPNGIVIALIRAAKRIGGVPLVNLKDDLIIRELCLSYDEDEVKLMADCELYTLRQMDAFIGLRGFMNISELSDVPGNKLQSILKHYIRPVHLEYRNENTKWVAVRWPTPSMAQRAGLSTEAFEDFYFGACTLDYAKMDAAMDPLVRLMEKTDQVRIVGPGDTDISFSIKHMPPRKYAGQHNLPDGELLTAPVRDSVNGRIHYNVASVLYGTTFEDICFDFKDGKIVHATSNRTEKINEILDQDMGARYVGEFAFGFNPFILKPIKDVLFDEKITGSIHLTPGNAYKECDNGNRSALHWDLVLMQTPEMGGGEIYFDTTRVRKDGAFVLAELEGLNPENLR